MIGGSPIGAGAIVRPFYNRPPAAAPPAIARTLVGSDRTLPDPTTGISVPSDIPAGALVLAATCYNNRGAAGTITPSFITDGRAVGLINQFFPGADTTLITYALALGGTGISAGDFLEWNFTAGLPTQIGMLCIYVTGLAANVMDRDASNTGAGTDQDSGLTAATTVADEFVWGTIGTNGRQIDAVGAWQAGLAAGVHVGGTAVGADLKEGFAVVAATGQYRSRVTGATSRDWASYCQCWR